MMHIDYVEDSSFMIHNFIFIIDFLKNISVTTWGGIYRMSIDVL